MMNAEIHMHDSVALLQDTTTTHFESGRPLLLRRGQIGTVVMIYDAGSYDVEFSGRDGRAYALLPIPGERLMLLRDSPEFVAS
jgi:hypothetical protein